MKRLVRPETRKFSTEGISVALNVALAIFAGLSWYEARKAAKVGEQQINQMKEELAPRLEITGKHLDDKDKSKLIVSLKNSGRSSAENVSVRWDLELGNYIDSKFKSRTSIPFAPGEVISDIASGATDSAELMLTDTEQLKKCCGYAMGDDEKATVTIKYSGFEGTLHQLTACVYIHYWDFRMFLNGKLTGAITPRLELCQDATLPKT